MVWVQPWPDYDSRSEVKVFIDDLQKLLLALWRGAVGEQGDGERVGHSNRIRHLEKHSMWLMNMLFYHHRDDGDTTGDSATYCWVFHNYFIIIYL